MFQHPDLCTCSFGYSSYEYSGSWIHLIIQISAQLSFFQSPLWTILPRVPVPVTFYHIQRLYPSEQLLLSEITLIKSLVTYLYLSPIQSSQYRRHASSLISRDKEWEAWEDSRLNCQWLVLEIGYLEPIYL